MFGGGGSVGDRCVWSEIQLMKLRRNSKPRPTAKTIRLDLAGQRFGKWTVLGFWKSNKGAVWLCQCACGDRHAVHRSDLRSGSSSSCATCARQRLGLTIDGVWHSTAEAKEIPSISAERIRQLRNKQSGLCGCGRERAEGYQRCSVCRDFKAAYKARKKKKESTRR